MSSSKLRKISKIVKEMSVVKSQKNYDISGLTISLCKFYYREPQKQFKDLPIGDYTIETSHNTQTLIINNATILDKAESIQVCYELDLTSSKYESDFEIDINRLASSYNEAIDDLHNLWSYIRNIGMVADDTTIDLILPQLDTNEVWVKTEDGYKGVPLDDVEQSVKEIIEKYSKEKIQEINIETEQHVNNVLKPMLDEYEENIEVQLDMYTNDKKLELDTHEQLKEQELNDLKEQLAKELDDLVKGAVADKGVMPNGTDWHTLTRGSYYVLDLFNSQFKNHPYQLASSDEERGIVIVTETEQGMSKVITYHSTSKRMFFTILVKSGIWSEWSVLGGGKGTVYEITQPNHGFNFNSISLGNDGLWELADPNVGADAIAIKIDNDRFQLLFNGQGVVPTSSRDDLGNPFVEDEYYFMSIDVPGGLRKDKPKQVIFQPLFHTRTVEGKLVADIQIGEVHDLTQHIVDNETIKEYGIATEKDLLKKLDKVNTIEELKSQNLKVGDIVEVLGYYEAGDGANHKRVISNTDDGSGVQLTNGLWANRIKKNATVVFTFDDNKILDNEVYELFKNKGLTCTFGAITNLLFHNNSNTLENLYKYTKDGFEIISHGGKHIANLTDVNLAKYEYEESRIALNKLGFDARGFIAPYSEVKDEVLQICENAYDYILIGGDGIHYPHKFPKNKKLTRVHLNTKTLDEKKALIKRAMQEDLLIIFYAHQTDKGDDFVEFINWISQQPIKIKNASDGVFDFYPELKDTGYVLTDNSGFADLSIERNNNSLSNKLNNKQYYVYDHNSIGVTIKDKTIKIPACQKSSTISIQAYFDLISWWSTYKILTSVKFSNVLSNKFKVTQEVILFKNSEEKLSYPAQLIESSADKFSNNVFYTTNNQTANKLKLVIRIVALEQTTSTTDFEVDSIKVFDLSKANTVLPKPDIPEQFSCKNITSILDDAQTFNKNGLSVVVPSLKKDMGIIVVNPATDLNNWSYQFGFDNSKKSMVYRYYNVPTSSWSKWIQLEQAQNVMKKLDTPHYARLMQKEGCLDDFDAYLIEKNIYDKEQIKLEEQRQQAYQEMLKENPNLSYEEFMSVQQVTLNLVEEPQPSQALQEFIKKYL